MSLLWPLGTSFIYNYIVLIRYHLFITELRIHNHLAQLLNANTFR